MCVPSLKNAFVFHQSITASWRIYTEIRSINGHRGTDAIKWEITLGRRGRGGVKRAAPQRSNRNCDLDGRDGSGGEKEIFVHKMSEVCRSKCGAKGEWLRGKGAHIQDHSCGAAEP